MAAISSPEHIKEMTCGKLYYRTFHMDERRDVLYVGAMWVHHLQGRTMQCGSDGLRYGNATLNNF